MTGLRMMHRTAVASLVVATSVLVGSCDEATPQPPGIGALPGRVDRYDVGDCYAARKPIVDAVGRVWIVNDNLVQSICYLSPTGSLTALKPAEAFEQRDGAVDSRGRVWMVGYGDRNVFGVPELVQTSASGADNRILLDRSLDPAHIAIGSDDAMWVSGATDGSLSDDVLERIVVSGKHVVIKRFVFAGLGISAITVDKQNRLWYASRTEVGTISASGKRTTRRSDIGARTSAMILTARGDLWYADESGAIGEVSAEGAIRRFVVPHTSGGLFGIAFGGDGRLWFVEGDGDRIGAMTTAGEFTQYLNPASPGYPSGITAAPDGSLWVVSAQRLNEQSLKEYSTPYLIHIEP